MYQSVCTVSLQTSYTRTNLIMTLINCILYQDRRVLILLSTEVFYIYINLVHVVDIAHVIKFGITTQVMLNQILCFLASTPSLTLLFRFTVSKYDNMRYIYWKNNICVGKQIVYIVWSANLVLKKLLLSTLWPLGRAIVVGYGHNGHIMLSGLSFITYIIPWNCNTNDDQ